MCKNVVRVTRHIDFHWSSQCRVMVSLLTKLGMRYLVSFNASMEFVGGGN